LVKTLQRVKEVTAKGTEVFATPGLHFFLYPAIEIKSLVNNKDAEKRKLLLDQFASLDDHDIMVSAKGWANHPDKTLSMLSSNLVNRKLYRIEMQNDPFLPDILSVYTQKSIDYLRIKPSEINYFVFCGEISNNTYQTGDDQIKILLKSGKIVDITEASDMFDQRVLSRTITKHFLCYPKGAIS
jgi:hypothetical protein